MRKYKFGGYIVAPVGKFNGHIILLVNGEVVSPSHSDLEPVWTPEEAEETTPKNRKEGPQNDTWPPFIYEQGSGTGLIAFTDAGVRILTNPRRGE